MTRRVSILVYCLVIALLLLGLQSWSVAVGLVERYVIAGIEDRIGLDVTRLEKAEIAFLPLPRISLSNVGFSQRDGLLNGSAVRLRARARLLPLLAGRLTFDRIELIGPQIDVAVKDGEDDLASWLAPPLTYLEGLKNQGKIVITSGSIFMRAQGAIRTILRDVNLVVEDRQEAEPISLSGSLNWRGAATTIGLLWPVVGENARLALMATSEFMALKFDGVRSGAHDPVINGQLSLSGRSLPALLGWFGERPRLAGAIEAFSLSAAAQIKPRDISLANVSLGLDGERLDGVLKLSEIGGRLSLSGTLAGAALDLGKLYARLDLPSPGTPGTGVTPLDFEPMTGQDIDLRISVDAARIGQARISDVATYLMVKKGRFEIGLLHAGAYGGSVKGRLLAVAAPGGVDARLQAGIDKLNLGQAAADLPELARLSGIGGLQLTLDGVGRTLEEVVGSFNGKASLNLRQGELAGFGFIDLLRRAERNPLVALRDWRQGKTPFESATASATIANGIATVTEAQMTGSAYRVALGGQVSLAERWLDMAAVLSPLNGSLKLPFTLRGPFDNPTIEPDADAIPRPTGAILPMLLR
ncbi:AsmA family protein [Bosea sp. PAMC 26642]|uniref:AsmA family protein n=1 Tax=Bosea sp. (strain PAMC 26642) TaxID=1792307 RepID=UPI00076FF420|nr:AsmA-like C-terminal region-containing protein [Bosea sp. PAMC 26642]AMJ59427.1 hypothetical protein AXW83_03125 [Bosea sp. PAMC 26642]